MVVELTYSDVLKTIFVDVEGTEKMEKKYVKIIKNKIITIAIAIFLMLSMSASMMLVPTATAHTPAWQIPTYAYINVAPNPIGVGQPASVYLFLTNYYYGAQYGNDLKFHNYKLTITAPNGAVTTQNFATVVDSTSDQHTSFIPDQVGTYNLTFTYPGETYTSTELISGSVFVPPGPNDYTNDTFLPSSASTTLTVQQTAIPAAIASYPLPTAYWTRPIYGENSYWYTITSNWLGTGAPGYGGWSNLGYDAMGFGGGQAMFPGDAVGSQTSHVMWTKSLQSGGVVGGNDVGTAQTYFDGSAYLIRFDNPIILAGMLYYTEPLSFSGSDSGPTDCVNLQTGQLIWSRTDVPTLTMGLVFDVQTQNEHGVTPPILVAASGSTWMGYDGDTGNWLFNMTNVPALGAGKVMGPSGEYLNYVMANAGTDSKPDWRLGEWNSTKVFMPDGSAAPTLTGTLDGSVSTGSNTCYDWNVSIPWLNTMTSTPTVVSANYNDGILCYNGTLPSNGENMLFSAVSTTPYTYFFVNLNASRGAIGSVSWWNTLQPPANNYTVVQAGVDWNTRIFLQSYKEATQWVGFSLDSGKQIWIAQPQTAFDYYGSPSAGILSGQIAYGRLYSCAMGGILYCYDDTTGKLLWTYGNGGEGNSTNSGFNWPYGNIPTFVNAIGNGIVYLITSEHTWVSPLYKGGLARAVNATDGTEIWTISSATIEFGSTSYAMADGYNTWFNSYSNQIYTVGRGPSATTVSAPNTAVESGSPVVIRGTVTDISAGTKQDQQAADFPNGVPVASDASMSSWMGYVYQQKPLPTNFTGVPVTISVVDSNNNFRTIGTATTDATGMYTLTWTPDISGNFTVYANFAGTNGYWPSYAETSFVANSAHATTAPTATAAASVADTYFVPAIAGLFVLIIIVLALVALQMFRKRP
ncbi:MAG: PQQ-binding-like beta-propeller repeat protein [Candidatus Bathyarchaeia archaeon]